MNTDTLTNKWDSVPQLLSSGVEKLETIRSNTSLDFIEDGLNLIAIISIAIAAITFFIEFKTWFGITGTKQSIINEAEKNRVDKECQYRLFQDIIRHLYRNKVCTMAMKIKTEIKSEEDKKNAQTRYYYPSEEHILKLKLLPSDIHLEEYYRDAETYQKLHEMELLLRNYNIEVDSAFMHIPNAEISKETKNRDYGTLNFKAGFLTERLIELMNKMWTDKDNLHEAQTLIYESQQKTQEENAQNMMQGNDRKKYENEIANMISKEAESDEYTTYVFPDNADKKRFIERFTKDILIECGKNKKDEEKIHIITRNLNNK